MQRISTIALALALLFSSVSPTLAIGLDEGPTSNQTWSAKVDCAPISRMEFLDETKGLILPTDKDLSRLELPQTSLGVSPISMIPNRCVVSFQNAVELDYTVELVAYSLPDRQGGRIIITGISGVR